MKILPNSPWVKIRQIPCVNFETTSQFHFIFFIIFQCHYLWLLCKFAAHPFCTLDERTPWKYQFWHFQVIWWKFAKLLVILQTTSQFFFKFYLALQYNEIYSSVIFLGQTLYTLHKSDQWKCNFFRLFSTRIKINQLLQHSLVSWDITPPYYF